jgi:hypothetical protein
MVVFWGDRIFEYFSFFGKAIGFLDFSWAVRDRP